MQDRKTIKTDTGSTGVAPEDGEKNFRLLVETMAEGFAELDLEGRWTYMNPQMGRLLGLDPSEAIGHSPEEFLDAENRKILADVLARRDQSSPEPYEISWTKISGEIVHGRVSPRTLFDDEGRVRGSFAVITDITERKKTEERLTKMNADLERRVEERTAELEVANKALRRDVEAHRESNAALLDSRKNYDLLLNNSILEMLVLSRAGVCLAINERSADRMNPGSKPEDIVGQSLRDLFPPRSAATYMDRIEAICESGKPTIIKERYELGDEIVWAWLQVRPIQDDHGENVAVHVIGRDITEEKKAEEALKESEERLRTVLENTPNYIYMLDRNGNILFGNRTIPELDVDRDLIGNPIAKWALPESQVVIREAIENVFETGETVACEIAGLGPGGTTAWYACRIAPIQLEGEPEAVVFVVSDISELKQASEELEATHRLTNSIRRIQEDFITGVSTSRIFDQMLDGLLALTESEYGFIGEILKTEDGRDYLKTHAITNIAWDDATRRFYEINAEEGLEFHNLDTLFGHVMTSGGPVLSNEPGKDPRASGIPEGHPPLNAFLGVPIHFGGDLVGMMAIANRLEGYDDRLLEFIQPFVAMCGPILGAVKSERDRSVSEAALIESGRRTRSILDGMYAFAGLLTVDGVLVEANSASLEGTGYAREEVLGLPFWEAPTMSYSKEVSDQMREAVRRAAGGEAARYDLPLRTATGEIVVVDVTVVPAFDSKGEVSMLVVSGVEVTERRRTEDALRVSESRLAEAQRIASVGSYTWDMVANKHEWSDEFYGIWGYHPGEIEPSFDSMLAAVHPGDREIVESLARQLASGKDRASVDYRVVHTSGAIRTVHVETEMVFDQDGSPLSMRGTALDITERKIAEDALRGSEARLAEAQRQARLGHWSWEIESDELNWSDEIYRIIGRSPGDLELTREAFQQVVHPEDREFVDRYVQQAAEGAQMRPIDYRIVLPSGEIRYVTGRSEIITDASDRPVRMTGTFQDITDRKLAERELERYRGHLEELVEERTAELREVQEELVRKERLATLGQLTGTVSHELRNPLGTIRNSLFSIKEILSAAGENANSVLDRANRGIDRCDRIIEELLEYTRTRPFELVSIDIDSWMHSLISEFDCPAHIQLETSFMADTKLSIDNDRLYRCMVNLLSNAVQAVDELDDSRAPKKIFVRTALAEDFVLIEVADSGPGIEPENFPKMFEPLFSTKGFGVGLGLCIVKQTAEGHGGTVSVRSNPNSETLFTISIPRASELTPKA